MLNLNETADLHYRYKMPRIEARVESRGNGIKTAVLNLAKVSNALSRPPAYMLKYLSYELGCVSDDTNDRYIINGAHSSERIQALVYSFIKKFILCSACSNPETNIRVVGATVKKSVANLECTACGSKTLIDNSHKLTSYIIKNPPSDKYEQLMTNKRQGKNSSDAEKPVESLEQDLSKDEKKLEEDMKTLLINTTTETLDQKLDNFENYMNENFVSILRSKSEKIPPQQLKDMFNYIITKEIKPYASLVIGKLMFPLVCSESKDITSCVTSNWQSVLGMFLAQNQPAQLNFLVALEDVLCFKSSDPTGEQVSSSSSSTNGKGSRYAIKSVQKLFLWLYNESLIDSDSFIQWFNRLEATLECPANLDASCYDQLKESSRPFINWLNEEDSSEDDDDDRVHGGDSDGQKRGDSDAKHQADPKHISTNNMAAKLAQKSTSSVSGSGAMVNDDEEDIDIDDI